MIIARKTITISLIFILFVSEQNQASRVMTFRGGSSRFSPQYFSNFSLFTQNGSISVDMMVIKPLVAGFKANVMFQLRLSNSKAYQTIVSYTLDICDVVISLKESIFKKWFKSLLKYGNFMQNCPVVEGHYYLHNWKFDPSMTPSYLYPGDYRLKAYCFMGKYKTKSEVFVIQIAVDAIIL